MSKSRKNKVTAKTAVASEATPAMNEFFSAMADQSSVLEHEAEALAELEAAQAQAEAEATPAIDEAPAQEAAKEEVAAPAIERVEGDLKVMKANFSMEEKETMKAAIVDGFTARKAFEQAQPGLSPKMIPNLDAEEKKMATIGAAGLFLAMDIDTGFINREIAAGSRFNVYAFQKVNDLIVALDGGFLQNAINKAIVASLFNFRDAGVPFTGVAATAAASDKIKVDRAIAKHLVRHTVSPATAPTQKSSTMTALKTLGVVVNIGTRGNEVWQLTDTPQTRRLEEVIRGKAA